MSEKDKNQGVLMTQLKHKPKADLKCALQRAVHKQMHTDLA